MKEDNSEKKQADNVKEDQSNIPGQESVTLIKRDLGTTKKKNLKKTLESLNMIH